MESVLWNIIPFLSDTKSITTVSTDWRSRISEYTDFILDGLRNKYPAQYIQGSMILAVMNDDIDNVRDIGSISSFLPIWWDGLLPFARSNKMRDLIRPHLSQFEQDKLDIRNKMITKDSSDRDIYLSLIAGIKPSNLAVSRRLRDVIKKYGTKDLPEDMKKYLSDMDIHDPRPFPNIIDILTIKYNAESVERVFNLLKSGYILSHSEAIHILEILYLSTDAEKLLQGYVLGEAIHNGWLDILDKYLNNDTLALSLMYVLGKKDIPASSWKYIESIGEDPSWYKYYADIDMSRPVGMDPELWRVLLPKAIMAENFHVIEIIGVRHRHKINNEFLVRVLRFASKYTKDVDLVLTLLKGM